MPANYNKTAWFYDALSRLVYGDTLNRAQRHLLHLIPANAHILIIGGGTGQILSDITVIHPAGLTITYVEISANMIALARKRDAGSNQIHFIEQPIENVNYPGNFEVIITGFLFDNYTAEALAHTFPHISNMLKPGGLWLNTDFRLTGRWWQWLLLKSMYLFFKLFSKIEASGVPDVKPYFTRLGYRLVNRATFYGDFVITEAWQKGF